MWWMEHNEVVLFCALFCGFFFFDFVLIIFLCVLDMCHLYCRHRVANIEQPANNSLLGNVVWSVSNLCRGRPNPSMELVEMSIPSLVRVIRQEGVPMEALVDAVWSLAYLSDGSDDRIQKVMDSGVTPQLVALLEDSTSPVLIPAVRCLGNFVTGNELQTQAVIDAGILKHLRSILSSARKVVRKEGCWLASNIAAGTQEQIDRLLRQGSVMRSIVDNALNGSWETRKEAIWAICNVCTTGTDLHVKGMMACDGLRALTNVIEPAKTDAKLLLNVLDAIFYVLRVGERTSTDYGEMLEELDGVQIIENLQDHKNLDVYEKAVSIVETFFGGEEVDEDENLVPETNDNGTFAFGITSPPPAKQLFPPQVAGEKFMFGSPPPKAFGSANTVNTTMMS
jgi:importin subunit alpha-6/7